MVQLSLSARKTYLLWACILLCVLPFVILSFFNFMAFDDYLLWGAYRDHGFFEMQKAIYLHWEGRFTANFICGVFEVTGIVRHYYFLVFLLFSFFTWAALLLLLDAVNVCCLSRAFSLSSLLLASLILFVMDLYVMAEISSGVYWFSAAAVYQTAFILFLVLAAAMVRRFAGGKTVRYDVAIILLAILICGCNEIAAIALACCFLLLISGFIYFRFSVPRVLLLYLGVVLLTGLIIALTSGVLSFRQTVMQGQTGSASVVLILLMRGLSVFFYVLKEPLFWACAAASYILGARMSSSLGTSLGLGAFLGVLQKRRFFIPGLIGIVLLVFFTLAPVLIITHGSIPERAMNNLTALAAFYLLAMVFLSGACNPTLSAVVTGGTSRLLVVLLSCALLANYNYKEAWKNVITGYFYHAIQTDRQKILLSAREKHLRSAAIMPYAIALEEKVRRIFPKGAPVTFQRLLQDRPTLLYYDNEAEEPPREYLLSYYQLDSVVVGK